MIYDAMKKIGFLMLISAIALIGCNAINQSISGKYSDGDSFLSSNGGEADAPDDAKIFDNDSLYDFSSFYLEEFESELTLQDKHYVYLGSEKLLLRDFPFTLFAADINHDGYRELLYETMTGSASTTHTIAIYDLYHRKELFKSNEQRFGSRYMHRFGLVNNQLMINLCPLSEPMNANFSMFDYSPIVLNEENDLIFSWQNKYGIESLMLVSITSDDETETINVTKIDDQDVYKLSASTPYRFTIKMNKVLGAISDYPESDFAICVLGEIEKHFGEIKHENGVYTLVIEFSPSELTQILFSFIDFSLSVSLIVE